MSNAFEETVLKSLSEIKQDVQRLEVLHEETAEKIDQIIEVVSPEIQRTNEHSAQINAHEKRITKLEQSAA